MRFEDRVPAQGRRSSFGECQFQQPGDVSGRFRLEDPPRGDELGDEGGEIFHVGANDRGFAGRDRFGRVLSTGGEKRFPDQNDVGEGGPGVEFAGGIDQKNVGVARNRRVGTALDSKPGGTEFFQKLRGALDMAGADEETEVTVLFPKCFDSVGDEELLLFIPPPQPAQLLEKVQSVRVGEAW